MVGAELFQCDRFPAGGLDLLAGALGEEPEARHGGVVDGEIVPGHGEAEGADLSRHIVLVAHGRHPVVREQGEGRFAVAGKGRLEERPEAGRVPVQALLPPPPVMAVLVEEGVHLAQIDEEEALLAERWNPILDVFQECGVKFALEVHPTEIAFDIYSAERAVQTLGGREEFGFNFDPSHLIWQGVDPVEFIRTFPNRIYHVHMKDASVTLNGRTGILTSHLPFGDPRRGWDFRSVGRGGVRFEEIIRALNAAKYTGPLSVEWEDMGMDREAGAREAAQFCKNVDFESSNRAFDAAFGD